MRENNEQQPENKFTRFFKDMPIKVKMMWIILTVVAVVLSITIGAFSVNGVHNIKKQLRDELAITATIITSQANTAIFYQNNSAVTETLSSLNANQSIRIACIYDKTGRIFARHINGQTTSIRCPAPHTEDGIFFTNNALKLYQEIIDPFDRTKVASLYIESDLQKIKTYAIKQTYISIIIILLVASIAFILASYLQRLISQPIRSLIDKNAELEYFRPSQDYLQSNDEMHKLQIMVNGILEQAQKYQKKAVKATNELNEVVKNAECTFGYLINELKQPLQSTMAYADMINTGALGQEEQVSYYNDVYFTVFFYYGVINDTMEFYKKHLGTTGGHKDKSDVDELIKTTVNKIQQANPGFMHNLEFNAYYSIDQGLPKLRIDEVITRELLHNVLFVFSKYITFLELSSMTIDIKAGQDFSDPDVPRFKVQIDCRELNEKPIGHILENHREYQNDVHLLRSKLQYLKYLASYDGSHLDFGDDLRNMSSIVIMYPWTQVNPPEEEIGNDNVADFASLKNNIANLGNLSNNA